MPVGGDVQARLYGPPQRTVIDPAGRLVQDRCERPSRALHRQPRREEPGGDAVEEHDVRVLLRNLPHHGSGLADGQRERLRPERDESDPGLARRRDVSDAAVVEIATRELLGAAEREQGD